MAAAVSVISLSIFYSSDVHGSNRAWPDVSTAASSYHLVQEPEAALISKELIRETLSKNETDLFH